MQYSRRYTKARKGKKRAYRRKRRTVTRVRRNVVSDSTIVKMKYVTQFTLDPTTGVVATKEIFANVANNPEDSSGHQPMGWDQWSQFYDKYIVLGSKCSVMFHTTSSTNSAQNIVAIRLVDDALDAPTITGVTDLLEQRGVTYKPLTNITSAGSARLSKNYSAKKHHGNDLDNLKGRIDDTTLGQILDGGQESETSFQVILLPSAASQDPSAVFCTATISYIVKFLEPKSLASS